MAVEKITIERFLEFAKTNPVLDARSPAEYAHAHIPGAYSLPLFTDEERKVVGTAYKQQSRELAIKIGLDYFGLKMRKMVEEVETIVTGIKASKNIDKCVLVHCWRGGMRSAGVAWLLDLYGFKVYSLAGGYKKYREWARMQFETEHNFTIIGGYTGSGKTLIIKDLKRLGRPVIDLEGLANHKGSAFGALGENVQPAQEMFENLLATELFKIDQQQLAYQIEDTPQNFAHTIYLEDESQRIGLINLPTPFWNNMRKSAVCFVDIPFEERLNYLTTEYGKFEKEKLINAIVRIQKRLGGLETKTAVNYLLENNHKESFRVLLRYYDKCYAKSLLNREDLSSLVNKMSFESVDVKTISNTLMNGTFNVT